eukprot:CAMPEP_0171328230 /NCGR_PEP_ID=MMETSP0878-20121228/529_1 /TAXON_ID=67004 /ORGANISM="Thalassiosira weissflogii, Strain CCMP1336" /LENGTH=76 /DNA_ID=CAMNT_0011828065 /DNA_START=245 /DNA_END=475 /DNA_ORIENTATION=+
MGGCLSRNTGHLDNVDDSVHVMLAHDRKKRKESGDGPSGYKPRAANPALVAKREDNDVKAENTTKGENGAKEGVAE